MLGHNQADTSAWFALQFAPRAFGLFGAFPDEDARDTHLNGQFGSPLMQLANEYLP